MDFRGSHTTRYFIACVPATRIIGLKINNKSINSPGAFVKVAGTALPAARTAEQKLLPPRRIPFKKTLDR